MSAIVGVLWFDGAPADAGALSTMMASCASYGPDAQQAWVSGSIALGQALLRTTPEAAHEQPLLASPDGTCRLAWDGRLDNRGELRAALRSCGIDPRTDSDAELVLQAYRAWGESCASRLLGDFAFAVWDARTNALFCVRDPTGARPLYWAGTDRLFAFASHEEALLHLPGVSGRRYAAGIARFVAAGIELPDNANDNAARTWYENVRFMRAGQWARVDAGARLDLRTYWKPEPLDEAVYRSDGECEEAFLHVFGEATRDRLRTVGDAALLMSGGLDTAAIVALARRHAASLPGQLHAYSAISDAPQSCVESRSILSMAEGLGERFHAWTVPSCGGIAGPQDLLAQAWPFSHPEDNAIWLQAVLCATAVQDGRRVVLQGAHGDMATWAPQRYIAYSMREGDWATAWQECRAASRNHTYLRHLSATRIGLHNLWSAYAPPPLKRARARTRVPAVPPRLLNRGFLDELGWSPAATTTTPPETALRPAVHLHAEVLRRLTNSRSAMPRVAGRLGVEARDPWEDRRVVEFFLRLPVSLRVRNGWTKHLVRQSLRNDFEARVLWRRGKEHLGWSLNTAALARTHTLFQDALGDPAAPCWRYLDREAARASYRSYLATHSDAAAQDLFTMLTLHTWLARIAEHT